MEKPDHPWVARFASLGERAIWELCKEAPVNYTGQAVCEGAIFTSEEEKLAVTERGWRDLVSGGSVFKEFICWHKDGSPPFLSWEEAENWLKEPVQ